MTTIIKPKLNGWIRQAPDKEDHTYASKGMKLKEARGAGDIDLRAWCTPVENQRDIGSCVANAVVGGLELLRKKNGLEHVDLSRLFLYYNSRLMHDSATKDEGTIIRLAMGTLSSLGTCPEVKWPYDTSKVFIRPTWGCYREAYGNKIGKYELISGKGQGRIDYIIDALAEGYPVAFGMDITESFMNVGNDGETSFTGPGIGGHAMLIVGVKRAKQQFILRNSWGTSWGDLGYAYLPFGALDDQYANDFWVPREVPEHFKK